MRPVRRLVAAALVALVALAALAGCATRPLTAPERALLAPLLGSGFDAAPVRVATTPGVGLFPISFDARPRVTCRERITPPPAAPRLTVRTAGIVLFQTLFAAPFAARPDYAATYDGALDLGSAMYLAHEMTHVWQWQNRGRTGYHPARAFAEQAQVDDPYLFDDEPGRRFLDYGYEAQASLVEEYLCCATLDSDGARTARLRDLLRQALPVAEPAAFARRVVVPWARDLRGICG